MNRYCIVYEGTYNEWYSYVRLKDIITLAKYLNDKVIRDRYYVMSVYLTDDVDDTSLRNRCFFQSEYDNQYFLESYGERLLEQYRLEKLAV